MVAFGEVSEGTPSEQVVPRSYAKPAVSRGLYSQRCYLPMLPFTQHEMFLSHRFWGRHRKPNKKHNSDTETHFARYRCFLCIFLIPFLLQFDFRRVCAKRFLVSEVFLQRKNNHFSVIFESMSNREIAGIIILDGRYQSNTKTVTT